MIEKKRVLILTADAGFGHRSAANAVAAALQKNFADSIEVTMVNPLDDRRTSSLLRESQSDYDKIVREMPELYRFSYEASDASLPTAIVESGLTVLLYEVLQDILRQTQPDLILNTYPLYHSPLSAIFTVHKFFIPLYTIVTDLATVHRLWFNPEVDGFFIPTKAVHDLAISYGIPEKKLHLTGIPVSPFIDEDGRSKREIREQLGWDPKLPTVLAVGSKRVGSLLSMLQVINHFGKPLQLILVAGKDRDLFQTLEAEEWHLPVKLYEYTDQMPAFMRASDLIVCKAGGLIVTESLASGLPMILIDVLPGQEVGNAEYVTANGTGFQVESQLELLEVLAHLFKDDGALLQTMAENSRALGRPNAACLIADMVNQNIRQLPRDTNHARNKNRSTLLKLLSQFNIPWEIEGLRPARTRK